MDTIDFLNRRAVTLSPQDSVLFLYNLSSENNFNMQDVEVGPPRAVDAEGLTEVLLTGKNNKGLSGVGPVTGVSKLTYHRTNLVTLGLPADGSFFDIFRGEPNFLGSVEELKRRTSFNCSAADFDEEAFYPDANGVRRLKAKSSSWRFIGEISLGRPKRDDLPSAIPNPIRANLSSYDGIFVNNADRLTSGLIVSHRPDDINRLVVGMSLTSFSDGIVTFITDHLRRKNFNVVFSTSPVTAINLYGLKVVYKGPLRIGDYAPMESLTRVIALTVPAPEGLWSGGEIKLFYNPEMVGSLSQTASTVYPLNLVDPIIVPSQYWAMLNNCVVGSRYGAMGSGRDVADLFKLVTGVDYNPQFHGQLKVTYNGQVRPKDQLPHNELTARVVELVNEPTAPVALSGPLKLLYRAV